MTTIATHVRPSALLPLALVMVLAAGCASTGSSVGLGQAITLQPGEHVTLPNRASLRYLGVGADSRCPPDVQCIRAGDADVLFEFAETGQAARRVTVNTDPPATAPIGDWQLRLLALAFGKAPQATVQIDPSAH